MRVECSGPSPLRGCQPHASPRPSLRQAPPTFHLDPPNVLSGPSIPGLKTTLALLCSAEWGWSSNREPADGGDGRTGQHPSSAAIPGLDQPLDYPPDYPLDQGVDPTLALIQGVIQPLVQGVIHPLWARSMRLRTGLFAVSDANSRVDGWLS